MSKIQSPTLCITMVTVGQCEVFCVPAYEDLSGEIVLPAILLLPVPVSASVTARSGGDTGSCHLRSNNTEQAHIGQSQPQVKKKKLHFLLYFALKRAPLLATKSDSRLANLMSLKSTICSRVIELKCSFTMPSAHMK